MSIISINGTQLDEQPSGLNEMWASIGTTQTSINGNKQRTGFAGRKKVVMSWNFAKPETVRFFKALEDAVNAVSYANDNSGIYGGAVAFSGIISVNAGEYQRGGSQFTKLTVTIEEGEAYSA